MVVKREDNLPGDAEERLRPHSWEDYVGQEDAKANLRVMLDAAKRRGDTLEHLLFYGNSGLGKTTLAHVVAREMDGELKTCAGSALERAGDVAALLSNLEDGDILFVDECHRISKSIMETLYSAMEDFVLHIVAGRGPLARTMDITLPRFTLIGATTRLAMLSAPFRNRFGAVFQLSFYSRGDMLAIVRRSARILDCSVSDDAAAMIADRSRATPRIANAIMRRVRDFATVHESPVTRDIAEKAFASLGIDSLGLTHGDRRLLDALITSFSGGPAGIQALSAAAREEADTILDIYEPYLLQIGFLERTPRGRVATLRAYQHLGYAQARNHLL